MHYIEISDFGPIKNCQIAVNKFTILTGPQASGKSTIAKLIYFFLTADDVFQSYITLDNKGEGTSLQRIAAGLRNKFDRFFGLRYSYVSSGKMSVAYHYNDDTWIKIFLNESTVNTLYVDFSFSENFIDLIRKYEQYTAEKWDDYDEKIGLQKKLINFFELPFSSIYIPAGRSFITLLTDHISEIFVPLNTPEDLLNERNVDFCNRAFARMVLSLRKSFDEGMTGLLQDMLSLPYSDVDTNLMREFISVAHKILKGEYFYRNGEELLKINDHVSLKINNTSSGQQETVWIINIMFYCLLHKKTTFLILEEPEAHLYPDSQKYISEIIGLFVHAGNQAIITTHSPYILGELNNLLYANEIDGFAGERDEIIDSSKLLSPEVSQAFFVHNRTIANAMEDGLIINELIDGASDAINEENDRLMELRWRMEDRV